MDRLGFKEGEMIEHKMISNSIERAQKKVEENNFGIRKRLLEYDDVMNKQRTVVYTKRRHALMGERIGMDIVNIVIMLLNTESADAKIAIIIITKGTVMHIPFIILFDFLSLVFSLFILNFPASKFLNSVIVSPIYANGSITISKILLARSLLLIL